MSSTKPLDVVILRKVIVRGEEVPGEPYQEYGGKTKAPKNDWSCYIRSKESELFAVRCTNTTGECLAVRISVDACYIQQYYLRPRGEAGDTVTCYGTGSRYMEFNLVSGLTREGNNKLSRQPSEAGCIDVTAYKAVGSGRGLPPPEKPTEELDLPVSMDGSFWKLCVMLTGDEGAVGAPSPHAEEIGRTLWKRFATLKFNYRTEDELTSGRIRGVSFPPKQGTPATTSIVSSPGEKRKRKSTGDAISKKPRDKSPTECVRVPRRHPLPKKKKVVQTSDGTGGFIYEYSFLTTPPSRGPADFYEARSPREGSSKSTNLGLKKIIPMIDSDKPAVTGSQPAPFVSWPPDHVPQPDSDVHDNSSQQSTSQPATGSSTHDTPPACAAGPGVPRPQSQPQPQVQPQPQAQEQPNPQSPSMVVSNLTPPPTTHDNPGPEKSTATSTDGPNHNTPTLTAFLDKVTPEPLGFLVNGLEEVGISTVAELKLIACKPNAFRAKIPALADLHEREQFLWLVFRKVVGDLLKEDQMGKSVDNLVPESDPVRRFVRSLGWGERIDSEAFTSGLKGAGISSERDLLVLSRNSKKYTESMPFLREFAVTDKFGWLAFQVGLEGLHSGETSASIQPQDNGARGEGAAYIKWFLDTIDPGKPLGHLTDSFIDAGLTGRSRLLYVAEDIELALDSLKLFQGLAAHDQLAWAMIMVGLDNISKSA